MENKSEIKAIEKLYKKSGLLDRDIFNDIKNHFLTENVTMSGRLVLWLYDGNCERAMYIDNLTMLTYAEIEKELL